MNQFKILLLSLALTFSISACADHHDKDDKKVEDPKAKQSEVKKADEPKTERVCVEINGKEKCREVKKHKKHEGTQIPPK